MDYTTITIKIKPKCLTLNLYTLYLIYNLTNLFMAKRTITITKIYVNHESKDGKKYKSPLIAIYFKGSDGTEQKASSFVANDSPALEWQVGDTLELDFMKNGDFINFTAPKPVDLLLKRIEALEAVVFNAEATPPKPQAKTFKPVTKAPKNNPNATVEELEHEATISVDDWIF
jgi:hypothetical protein